MRRGSLPLASSRKAPYDPGRDRQYAASGAAIGEMRRLAREYGLFVGPSSGAHLLAARELRARNPGLWHVVTFFCDEGEKYINGYFLGA